MTEVNPPAETVQAVVAAARAAGPRCGDATIVAIDGPAGSGKTTLAGAVVAELDATVVHMDDLYLGWSGLRDSADRLRREILARLWLGRVGRYRRYDWHAEELAEERDVPAEGTVVVEGVGCVRANTRPFFSVIVWVEAADDVRLARGLARDGTAAEPHWRAWMADEADLFAEARTADIADLHVDAFGRLRQ
ncbi:AAA family ATPase [Ruania halotolerans]|uniref:AAA family ATPase n=1 Tax=Ruania halotolerans TaxID=2897773 RepID=UPI001E61D6A9|nr:AAA family ATPase [Ruania halotolerans]UFU05063.1 (d)CMP kinase [Ruania halotolerans]